VNSEPDKVIAETISNDAKRLTPTTAALTGEWSQIAVEEFWTGVKKNKPPLRQPDSSLRFCNYVQTARATTESL
jgi:hypothetical protein